MEKPVCLPSVHLDWQWENRDFKIDYGESFLVDS